jgi:hypothetical protein
MGIRPPGSRRFAEKDVGDGASFALVAFSCGALTFDKGASKMPKSWSKKDERQYEHVKESEKDQGRSTKRAKEIAARTVNKHRKSEGRTKSK